VIEVGANDLLLHVTEFSVILGMFVMLFGLLVPHATENTSATPSEIVTRGAVSPQAHRPPAQEVLVPLKPKERREAKEPIQPEIVPASTFAAIMAEAKRQVDGQEETEATETVATGPADKTLLARRITWPNLVDPDIEGACDLPTRLRLIEALSFIGGSWSIDILARAYEQELDANVRGAIFVALRDARSVA
jgi:hypothetical protein